MGVHVDVTLGNVAVGGLLHVNPFAQSHGDGSFTGLIGFLQFLLKHHAKDQNITFINAVIGQALGAEILPKFIIGANRFKAPATHDLSPFRVVFT